jgi:hypothetical protein
VKDYDRVQNNRFGKEEEKAAVQSQPASMLD